MPVWQNQRFLQTGNSHLRKIAITTIACTSKKTLDHCYILFTHRILYTGESGLAKGKLRLKLV